LIWIGYWSLGGRRGARWEGFSLGMRILILGGAGFVGSSLANLFKQSYANCAVVAFDNLRRRGSELNLRQFKQKGIDFVHGDIRCPDDLQDLDGDFDLVIEASAEPSVHAGSSGKGIQYLTNTNLGGTLNFLEFVRERSVPSVFLSTSRVYAIKALRGIPLRSEGHRFKVVPSETILGLTGDGINEAFPVTGHGFRSLYGTTKLAAEMFIEEYAETFKTPVVINRCGVIAGPGQFGKTDQGVFTLWVARHVFGGALQYTGFGGDGHQVRDLLHPRDLFALIEKQVPIIDRHRGSVFVVGGGMSGSVSLKEYTEICQSLTGEVLRIGSQPQTAEVDVPWYVSDSSRAQQCFDWQPRIGPAAIAADIHDWLQQNKVQLQPLFT
jgi:CDP-paratose 2-epimerase